MKLTAVHGEIHLRMRDIRAIHTIVVVLRRERGSKVTTGQHHQRARHKASHNKSPQTPERKAPLMFFDM